MSDPREPHYLPYHGNPAEPAGPPPPRGPGLAARLGERAVRRPVPRLGVSLAGAGIALAVVGVLVWGGDYLTGPHGGGGGGGSSSRRLLGVALSLAVVAAGYALVVLRRRGPLASAGVAASALGVPLLLGFLTFDTSAGGRSALPFSLDAVVLVSVLVWLVSYLAVPGARGHSSYLGLAAVAIWPYLVDKAEPSTFSLTPFLRVLISSDAFFGSQGADPDWTTVAVLSLFFGFGYYLAAGLLDRSGRPGPAVPLVVAGFLATATGIAAAAVNLHAIGTGILLIAVGVILAGYGARAGRRFTTWVWSAGVALGATMIIAKLAGHNDAAAGVSLIMAGAVLVLAGHVLAGALREPDEVAANNRAIAAMGEGPAY